MLEKLRFIKGCLTKGLSLKELGRNQDIVRVLLELDDPKLICLYIDSTLSITFTDLRILIAAVKNHEVRSNINNLEFLLKVLKRKPAIIQSEFSTEIREIEEIIYKTNSYLLNRIEF